MENVLIVSASEASAAALKELCSKGNFNEIALAQSCAAARRLLITRAFDLCVINTPLADETGVSFACDTASTGSNQVILIVKSELYDEISIKVEEMGVFTLAKPLNRSMFWSALKLAGAAHSRLTRLNSENTKLLQRIDDLRVVDRAKCVLIQTLSMSEDQAHKFIEKQAMDMRLSRRDVAESILKTYS